MSSENFWYNVYDKKYKKIYKVDKFIFKRVKTFWYLTIYKFSEGTHIDKNVR